MDPNELVNALGINTELPQRAPDYASMLGYAPTPTTPPAQIQDPFQASTEPQASPAITSPSQVPEGGPDNVRLQQPGRLSAGAGAGFSTSGYSSAANAAIQRGPHAALNTSLANDRASVEQSYRPLLEQEAQASDARQTAAIDEAHIESQKIAATSLAKQKIASANTDFMAKEQAAINNSKAQADVAQGQYRAALADYAAARVNPAQLWEHAGTGGQFAMIATAFAHDFLGAKGIQTSGLDSINKAIQNNISAQLENMRKKQDVASGFKTLWDMQRQQSSSDAEARQRMNGFYLTALGNQIESQLGGYDSQLALAKGQAAKAAIMQEQVKNDLLVRQHIDNAANQRATNEVHVYAADLTASSAKYAADAHITAAKIAAQVKADKASPLDGVVFDTSKTGGNVATRRFLPDVKPEERSRLREQTAKTLDTVSNVEKLIELQDAISRVPPTDIGALKKMQSEAARTAELMRNVTRMGIIYDNSGKQINEQEVKLYDEIVSKKDWWTNGDNVRQLGTLAGLMLQKNNGVMGAVSTEIQPNDPAYGVTSGTKGFDVGNQTLSDIQSQPGAGKPAETDARKYTEWAVAPNATKAYDVGNLPETGPGNKAQVTHDWAQFKQEQPWAAPTSETDFNRRAEGGPNKQYLAVDPNNPDSAFVQLERLADLALQGDTKAAETINTWAAGKPNTADVSGLLSAYAQWEKQAKGL